MNRTVIIKNSVFHLITEFIAEKSEIEIIALGFGFINESQIIITDLVRMKNLDNSPVSFSLDYEKMYKEIRRYEVVEKSLLGFFHTHPDSNTPYPSKKDLFFMQNWPYPYLWLIGGGTDKALLFIYALFDQKVVKLPFSISEE